MLDRDATGDTTGLIEEMGRRGREAAAELATATSERKHAVLVAASEAVLARRAEILAANDEDMGRARGLSGAMRDRLRLDEGRVRAIADALRDVAAQRDPVGEVMAEWTVPSGLRIRRVRTPIGVVGVIYESRPNVTADAGRAVPHVGQRRDPARRLGEPRLVGRDPRLPGGGPCAPRGCLRPPSSSCPRATAPP